MKISYKWLSEYIELNDYKTRIDELSETLTQAGLEVEGLEDQSENYKHVVMGRLKSVTPHPDADKLTYCEVDVGEPQCRPIVCGAKNHKEGDYVVAALPGAVLPGDFKIKVSKIRGVESQGMLCSEKELGLSGESEGIITLQEAKIGQSFSEAFEQDDIVFDLNVTPNRADCLSHLGLAHELSALINRPVFPPKPKSKTTSSLSTSKEAKVLLENTEDCPRYSGILMKNVKVGPSPQWLKSRLEKVGVNSINNIVDVTNYILFEYGQPLHAFDWQKIEGQEIRIRKSIADETMTSFDGTELKLTGQELVICDAQKVVALAGVVGGQNSGVTDCTTEIFLESAFFTAQTVRQTSRRFGFETDASYRFSRGTNPEKTIEAMKRAAQLMQELCGAEVASDHVDEYPKTLEKAPITIDPAYVSQRLGYEVPANDFFDVMKRLGCGVKGSRITPPTHRWDLEIPEDLVEEYGRVVGYSHLKETLPPLLTKPTAHDEGYLVQRRFTEELVGLGSMQVVNHAFVNPEEQKELLGDLSVTQKWSWTLGELVAVKNPISEEMSVMRQSLLPGLFGSVLRNCRQSVGRGFLFEQGAVHHKVEGEFSEELRLSFALWTDQAALWSSASEAVYQLKSKVEHFLNHQMMSGRWEWRKGEALLPFFHPQQCAELFWQGQLIGVLGTLHPSLKKKHKLRGDLAFAEFDLGALAKAKKSATFKAISSFPVSEKDLAFVLPETMKVQKVLSEIRRAAGPYLQELTVVDLFRGESLGEDKKSVSFRMKFQSPKGTLQEEELSGLFNKVIDTVSQKLSVSLR